MIRSRLCTLAPRHARVRPKDVAPSTPAHRPPPRSRSNSFYVLYIPGVPLYDWLVSDIAAIDYETTPWVVVTLHAPWYNSSE